MAKTPPPSGKAKSKSQAAAKKPTTPKKTSAEPRKLKKPQYQSFKMQKRIQQTVALPGSFRLFGGALKVLFKNWKLFLGVALIYGVLNLILVRGFSGSADVSSIKKALDQSLKGDWSQLAGGSLLFVYLLGSAGNSGNATAGAYQLLLTLFTTIALIWTLRQVYAGNKVRIRDGFYQGMYPFVTFILVLLVVGLQLLPGALGILTYSIVSGNGVIAGGVEQMIWTLALAVLILVSLYMVSSSVFALYIVCLPDMTPMRALRSARQLVAARRWVVMRKVLFLPVALALVAALITIPLIIYATAAASWVIFIVTMLLLPVLHSYMYRLYRALL